MKLILCEKPSQGRDIANVVGATIRGDGCLKSKDGSTIVTWAFGHIVEQFYPEDYDPELKSWQLKSLPIIPNVWKLKVVKKATKQYKIIQGLLKQADEVLIGTDADREGEVIAREVLELNNWTGTTNRLWLSALDAKSIQKALDNIKPGAETEPLYQAGLTRSRADWLVGLNLTRLYTLLGRRSGYDGLLSVGRVQTPTLRLVVDRDIEIENFSSKPFWSIELHLDPNWKATWMPNWKATPIPSENIDDEGSCINKSFAQSIVDQVAGDKAIINHVGRQTKRESAPLPFALSSLQALCDRKFGIGAQQTLEIAQSLYEKHKVASYPRTDCEYLPESQFVEANDILQKIGQVPEFSSWVSSAETSLKSRVWNDKKVTAHHGIIPTGVKPDMSALSANEQKVFTEIVRRYIAQFHPLFEYKQTIVMFNVINEQFRSVGKQITTPGWKILFTDKDKSQILPLFSEGDEISILESKLLSKETKPPARYTEGTLIAAMKNVAKLVSDPKLKAVLKETTGIGTEATRATVMETLLNRGFVKKTKKQLVSTETGRALIAALPEAVKSPGTTALWEQSLEAIANGEISGEEFIASQTEWLHKLVKSELSSTSLNIKSNAKYKCPKCEKPLAKRKGKRGHFWGCTGYRDGCDYTAVNKNGKPAEKQASVEVDVECEKCGSKMRKITKGEDSFLGCTNYPKCTHTKSA